MRTRARLVPFVLCTTGIVLLSLTGCRKEEKASEIPSSSPQSYMHDEAFRTTLAERRKVACSIGADRAKVEERLNEMRRIIGDKLKTKDRAAIEAALAENAEWKALQAKAKELDAAFERHRRETLRIVRERIAPGRSGRETASPLGGVKNGEAVSRPLSSEAQRSTRSTADKDISK